MRLLDCWDHELELCWEHDCSSLEFVVFYVGIGLCEELITRSLKYCRICVSN